MTELQLLEGLDQEKVTGNPSNIVLEPLSYRWPAKERSRKSGQDVWRERGLWEENLLSIGWIGVENSSFVECLSLFLMEYRIKEAQMDLNSNLKLILHIRSDLDPVLFEYCKKYFNFLPSWSTSQSGGSLLFYPRAVPSCLINIHILRDRNIQSKYPVICFLSRNFIWLKPRNIIESLLSKSLLEKALPDSSLEKQANNLSIPLVVSSDL